MDTTRRSGIDAMPQPPSPAGRWTPARTADRHDARRADAGRPGADDAIAVDQEFEEYFFE